MLTATDLVKRYGGVTALDSAGIVLRPGEIHALVGENGAGKSTLVKILSGVVRADSGRILLGGEQVDFHNPRDAAARGIAIVSQELSLFPDLTVLENLFPRDLPRRWGLLSFAAAARRAAPVLADLGLRAPAQTVPAEARQPRRDAVSGGASPNGAFSEGASSGDASPNGASGGAPPDAVSDLVSDRAASDRAASDRARRVPLGPRSGSAPQVAPDAVSGRASQVPPEALSGWASEVPLDARVGTLPLADQQLLEISRALLTNPRVLILDEPTSALPEAAVARLERVLRQVAGRGIAVLYISHILEEVRRIADRVSVLRDGRVALSDEPARALSLDDLVMAMLGEAPAAGRPPTASSGGPTGSGLVLEAVTVPNRLFDVSLAARAGEVVGVAGLEGAGHLAVLELVCGLARHSAGRVSLPGSDAPRSFRKAISQGVAFVPGDRKRFGLMLDRAVWENATAVRWLGLGRGTRWLRRGELMARAEANLARMRFRGDVLGRAGELSGGNQQKVVFAKWIDAEPSLMVLDDPTRGVDIGARAEMHDIIRGLAASGKVILIASTDLSELAELCHRVVVFRRGRVVGELLGEHLTEQRLSTAMNAGFALPASDAESRYAAPTGAAGVAEPIAENEPIAEETTQVDPERS